MNEEKKAELRAKNEQALKGKRPDASFFKSLDASIKKNSAFVKKIKSLHELTPDQKVSIVPDIQKLNLRRFISEIVQGFLEMPLKLEDVDVIVEIASSLHQLYAEFSESFVTSLVKSCKDSDKKEPNLARLHVVLLIITKLFTTRMHDNFTIVGTVLKGFITMNKKTSQSSILMPFLIEFQHDFLIGKSYNATKCFITEQEHKLVNEQFMSFFETLCERLRFKQKEINEDEQSTNEDGNIDKKKLKQWKKQYDLAKEAADILQTNIPSDIEDALLLVEDLSAKQEQQDKKDIMTDNIDKFVNERTRQFYEEIPDISILMNEKNELENIQSMEDLLDKLPKRPPIDKLATTLAIKYLSQKGNRTKLVKKMFSVNRTSLELLPYYSRLIAILNPLFKDIGKSLVQSLEEEFNKLFEEQDQIKIETKVKNIRFLGELILFKICPEETGIEFLKKCLSQFHHHNIDVACHFLEVCGRYLYAQSTTHLLMVELISKMMRIKDIKVLDVKYNTMIDSAYYNTVVNVDQEVEKPRSVFNEDDELTQYVLHLLLSELNKYNINSVLKQLRKLPFDDFDRIKNIIKSILSHIRECAFGTIHLLASVLGGLSRYHEEIGVVTIDILIEDIRYSLEQEYIDSIELGIFNTFEYTQPPSKLRSEQERVISIKFLGEFYNYQLLDINVIMDVLYMLILYPTPLQPHKQDTFRLRLVCTLLDTCGPYFETSADRKKLDRFLLYLQRYVLSKQYRLPVDMENMLADTLDTIRPKLKWPKNLKEVTDKIEYIEQQKPIPLPGQLTLLTAASASSIATLNDIGGTSGIGGGITPLALWPINDDQEDDFNNPTQPHHEEEDDDQNNTSSSIATAMDEHSKSSTQQYKDDELDKELMEMINQSINERKYLSNNIAKRGTLISKPQEMMTLAIPPKIIHQSNNNTNTTITNTTTTNSGSTSINNSTTTTTPSSVGGGGLNAQKITILSKQGRTNKAQEVFVAANATKLLRRTAESQQ